MTLTKQFLAYFLLSLVLLGGFGCDDDSPDMPVRGDIIIVNEGNFGQGNGSISLYDRITEEVSNNIFANANASRTIDASIQSVTVNGDQAFIVCNAADKIEIVNAETFEALQAAIVDEDLINPRYLTVVGDKAYVSVWGAFDENYALPDSKVAVIDLKTFTITKYIATEDGAEGIMAVGNKVFVANSYTNKLTVINTSTDEVEKVLTLSGSPVSLVLVEDEELWVSVAGASDQFIEIDTDDNTIETTLVVEGTNSTGKFAVNDALDMIYYIGAEPWPAVTTSVYALSMDNASASPEELISGNYYYAIGSDPLTNSIFVGNSNSFQGEGTVLRYDQEGRLLGTHAVGVGPNDFVF